jgi:hypothetical protein
MINPDQAGASPFVIVVGVPSSMFLLFGSKPFQQKLAASAVTSSSPPTLLST